MGSGFSLDSINVVRANRALVKKRKFKDIKQLLLETSGKTEVEFKQVSAEELARIKTEIRLKAYRKAQWEITIYGLCVLILMVLFSFLFIYLFLSN